MEQIGQLITQALDLKSQQGLTLSPTGLTATLQVAINSKPIAQCNDLEVQQKLAYAMMLVGIKPQNIPIGADCSFLINQIKKIFPFNRLSEIQLAFDLAIANQLDIEEKEINAYQDFTFIYFSRVFNSYRRWASVEYKQIEQQPVQRIYSAEELDDIHRGDVEAFYQRCLKGIRPPDELPEYYLSILIKDGYLAEGSDDLHSFFAYWIGKGYENIYKNGD